MKTQFFKNSSRSGAFTLAEAMVATAMGAVMLIALYGAVTYSYGTIKLNREDLRATQILVEQMENLRMTPFSQIANLTTNMPYCSGASGNFYTISIATSTPAQTDLLSPGVNNPAVWYAGDMLRITATATWTNANIQRVRTLDTYAARKGAQGYIANHK